MRKIEQQMIEAIQHGKAYHNDNTSVSSHEDGTIRVYLYGHLIAEIIENELRLNDCGYQTKTTKSRLNSILNHFELPIIYSKNFQWYIGTEVWNGSTSYLLSNKKKEESLNKCLGVLGF